MTQNTNWLGFSADFSKVEDEIATELKTFELLPEGWYKAVIKSAEKEEIGQKKTPCLKVKVELEDKDKEIDTQIWLPNGTNDEFKTKALKNFLASCVYSQLKRAEYLAIPNEQKNAAFNNSNLNQFIGAKVLVKVTQEPFVSKDKNTQAINWTNTPISTLGKIPKSIEKLLNDLRNNGIVVKNLPKILFSNRIALLGFDFYNEFNPNAELKDNYAKGFVDMYKDTTTEVIGNDEIGF